MLGELPVDVVHAIAAHLSLVDVHRLSSACADTRRCHDDTFWLREAQSRYSREFWLKAYMRRVAPQYKGIKHELLRLEVFQAVVGRQGFRRYQERDFFSMWDSIDKHSKAPSNGPRFQSLSSASPTEWNALQSLLHAINRGDAGMASSNQSAPSRTQSDPPTVLSLFGSSVNAHLRARV